MDHWEAEQKRHLRMDGYGRGIKSRLPKKGKCSSLIDSRSVDFGFALDLELNPRRKS